MQAALTRGGGPFDGFAMRQVWARLQSLSEQAKLASLLLLFTLAVRVMTLELPRAGGDGPRKWMWARVVGHGWSPSTALWDGWDHHAARLSINVPILLVQSAFGDHPALFYVAPLAALLAAVFFLFRIAVRCGSAGAATWSCVLWVWAAPAYWATDLMPSAFSPAYVLSSVLSTIRLAEARGTGARWAWACAAAGTMMLAELAKVTNLLFLPGILLVLWGSTKSLRWPLVVAGLVLTLLGAEWLG